MEQLHKEFTNDRVKDIMQRHINKELKREHVQQMPRIKRRQFFKLPVLRPFLIPPLY